MSTKWLEVEENMLSVIASTYERSVESLMADVVTLREWMKTQKHLPEVLDDKSLQNFLTLNKCSIEKAKQRIDMYYTLRKQIPEIFNNVNPQCEAMKEFNKIAAWVPMPKLHPENYRVWWFKLLDKTKSNDLDPFMIMGQAFALQEIRLKEDVMFGEVIVVDTEGFDLGFMLKFTPPVMVKLFAVYGKILSLPMKKGIVVNAPPYIHILMEVLKKVLKPKVFERIVTCKDTSVLKDCLPNECIPKEYGGSEKSVEELFEMAKIKMDEYQSRFDERIKMQVDESLRPEKLENDEILGFHGNFKKLNVD